LVVLPPDTDHPERHLQSDEDHDGQGQIGEQEAAFHVTGRRR
jgi:hypothetical protein